MNENRDLCTNQETESRIGYIGQRSSIIDLVFGTARITNKISTKQKEESWGSDHTPIEITIGEEVEHYRKKKNRQNKNEKNCMEKLHQNSRKNIRRGKKKKRNN